MKESLIFLFLLLSTFLNAQSVEIDSIDFYDTLKFERVIIQKDNGRIDYVSYTEKEGTLRMQDFFDTRQRIIKKQIWNDSLLQDTEYKYHEKNQIIKPYDVLNNLSLPTVINIQLKYPAMARENGIEGNVEVAFKYNSECVPLSFEVLHSLSEEIDKEVEKKMRIFIKLSTKYEVAFVGCSDVEKNLKLRFRLN